MKKNLRIGLILALMVMLLFTVTSCDSKPDETSTKMQFVADFSSERMLETIKVLSAVDNARIAGFEGESNAAIYIADQFNQMGLEVSEQSFPIKAYVCNSLILKVTSESDRVIEEAKALSFSAATPDGGLLGEIVPLGLGAESDYDGVDVEGKIVLMQRGGEFFFVKTARAAQKGAIGALFYDPQSEGAISATLTELSKIPAVSINRAEGEGIEKLLSEGNIVTVSMELDTTYEDSTSKNIKALYKSSENPEGLRLVIGAHYDGVDTPAANDNASGAAVILEMAKVISEQQIVLPYDVEFVAFGAEEIGLIGSEQYVRNMTREENKAIIAMINFDMVGVGDVFDIGTAEGYSAADLVKVTMDTLEEMGYKPTTSTTDRSDHAPFAYSGIDAVYVQVGPFHDYHTDLDTIEGIDPKMLQKVCELGAKLIVDAISEEYGK